MTAESDPSVPVVGQVGMNLHPGTSYHHDHRDGSSAFTVRTDGWGSVGETCGEETLSRNDFVAANDGDGTCTITSLPGVSGQAGSG